MHAFLRTVLASLYDEEVAQATRIQYGGSVTPDSVDELMSQPEIDGCLVGGGTSAKSVGLSPNIIYCIPTFWFSQSSQLRWTLKSLEESSILFQNNKKVSCRLIASYDCASK